VIVFIQSLASYVTALYRHIQSALPDILSKMAKSLKLSDLPFKKGFYATPLSFVDNGSVVTV